MATRTANSHDMSAARRVFPALLSSARQSSSKRAAWLGVKVRSRQARVPRAARPSRDSELTWNQTRQGHLRPRSLDLGPPVAVPKFPQKPTAVHCSPLKGPRQRAFGLWEPRELDGFCRRAPPQTACRSWFHQCSFPVPPATPAPRGPSE